MAALDRKNLVKSSKFNRAEIMKNAWRTYKYVAKKKGKSFGEVLASTWRLAKLQASVEEIRMKAKAELEARNEFFRNSAPAKKVSYANYSYEDLYGTFQSGRYVGD